MKNGVPYDVANSLNNVELFSWGVIFSEFNLPEKQHFNFDTMRFNES